MRGRRVAALGLALLACVGCTATKAAQPPPSSHHPKPSSVRPATPTTSYSAPAPIPIPQTQSPLAYLNSVLDLVQSYAYYSGRVNWPQVRRSAAAAIAGARSTLDTYAAIASALQALGDHHSTLIPPATVHEWDDESAATADQPAGWMPAPSITLLTVPGLTATSQPAIAAYLNAAEQAVTAGEHAGTCGWIVDLRQNTGGNMWPMLAAVAPLLGDGVVGSFVAVNGTKQNWTLSGGTPAVAGEAYPNLRNPVPAAGAAPVAVLTEPPTASAGEAIAVAFRGRANTRSFGDATAGVPTANGVYRLSDGAELLVMELLDEDRAGQVYDSPLPPDQPVPTDLADPGPGDPVRDAAVAWLRQQPACAH